MLEKQSNQADGSENSTNVLAQEKDKNLTEPVKTPIESSYQKHEWRHRSGRLHPKKEEPISNKKFILVGIGLLGLLLVVLVLFFMGVFRAKTNAEKLVLAVFETGELNKYEKYLEVIANKSKVSDDINNFNLYFSLLSQMGLKVNSKVDFKNSKSETRYSLSLKNIDFLDISIQENKRDYLIEIPKLFQKRLFLSRQGLYQLLDDYDSSEQMQLEANLETLNIENLDNFRKNMAPAFNPFKLKSFKKLNKQKYLERVLEYYNQKLSVAKDSRNLTVKGEDKEFRGDVYILKETVGESYEFYHNLLLDLVKDPNFKPFVEEYLDRIIALTEKHKDIVFYNTLAQFDDYTPPKANWDEEVKTHLVYWKQLVLDGIDQFAEKAGQPHYADQTAKTIKLLKDSNLSYEAVFVVDGIVKYFDFSTVLEIENLIQQAKQNAMLEPAYQTPLQVINFRIISVITQTGNSVQFNEMDKSNILDYANATKEEINALSEEIRKNAIKILDENNIL